MENAGELLCLLDARRIAVERQAGAEHSIVGGRQLHDAARRLERAAKIGRELPHRLGSETRRKLDDGGVRDQLHAYSRK